MATIIRDEGFTLYGLAEPGNGYLVASGTARYRIYRRLDGRWSFIGLNAWGRGYDSESEARSAACRVYGF